MAVPNPVSLPRIIASCCSSLLLLELRVSRVFLFFSRNMIQVSSWKPQIPSLYRGLSHPTLFFTFSSGVEGFSDFQFFLFFSRNRDSGFSGLSLFLAFFTEVANPVSLARIIASRLFTFSSGVEGFQFSFFFSIKQDSGFFIDVTNLVSLPRIARL
ncbi:hypothetical protein VPH35_008224 [Triticum aestivum]